MHTCVIERVPRLSVTVDETNFPLPAEFRGQGVVVDSIRVRAISLSLDNTTVVAVTNGESSMTPNFSPPE